MRAAKTHLFIVQFDSGGVTAKDPHAQRTLAQAAWRAQTLPTHKIQVEAHEDPHDPNERGAAARRLDAMRRQLTREGVDTRRLELRTHRHDCWCTRSTEKFVPRVEIRIFPRVLSLAEESADSELGYDEVCDLLSARFAALVRDRKRCTLLNQRRSPEQWQRIVGHTSLWEWAQAGASHPLHDAL